MHEFRITGEGIGSVEYVVLKCPACGRIQRFMHKQECFGKIPKNAGCKQCQKAILIEANCLDLDVLPAAPGERIYALKQGKWVPQDASMPSYAADYTTADKL